MLSLDKRDWDAFSAHTPPYLRDLWATLVEERITNALGSLVKDRCVAAEVRPYLELLLEALEEGRFRDVERVVYGKLKKTVSQKSNQDEPLALKIPTEVKVMVKTVIEEERKAEVEFTEGFAANWIIPAPDPETIDLLTRSRPEKVNVGQELDRDIRDLWRAFNSFFPDREHQRSRKEYERHIYRFVGLVRRFSRPLPQAALKSKAIQDSLIDDLEKNIRCVVRVLVQFGGVSLYDVVVNLEEQGMYLGGEQLTVGQLELLARLFGSRDTLPKVLRALHRSVKAKIASTRRGPRTVAKSLQQRLFMQQLVDHFSYARFPVPVTDRTLYNLVAATTNLALRDTTASVTSSDVRNRTHLPQRDL